MIVVYTWTCWSWCNVGVLTLLLVKLFVGNSEPAGCDDDDDESIGAPGDDFGGGGDIFGGKLIYNAV